MAEQRKARVLEVLELAAYELREPQLEDVSTDENSRMQQVNRRGFNC